MFPFVSYGYFVGIVRVSVVLLFYALVRFISFLNIRVL